MIIYYVAVNSPYFQSKKHRFACRCAVDRYIEKEKYNLVFHDRDAQEEFEKLQPQIQEIKRLVAFDIVSIDNSKCKKYKRMFPAKMYREQKCA